jgi:hypothetical protein
MDNNCKKWHLYSHEMIIDTINIRNIEPSCAVDSKIIIDQASLCCVFVIEFCCCENKKETPSASYSVQADCNDTLNVTCAHCQRGTTTPFAQPTLLVTQIILKEGAKKNQYFSKPPLM